MKDIKKSLIMIFAVLFVFAFTKVVFAATSGVYNIKVKIVEEQVGIEIVTSDLDFGYVVKGTSVTSGGASTAVKNIGAVNIDLKLKITDNSLHWSTGTTLGDTGTDKYVLATVFHQWNGLLVSTNPYACFKDNDVLTIEDKTAGTATGTGIFASEFVDGQAVATPEGNDGVDIEPGTQVNNFFFFNAPTSLSSSAQYGQEQSITVTVTAVQHQ
jgi:hypothetical protein